MAIENDLSSQFALDMQGLERMKQSARNAPREEMAQAAKQFEAILMQMVMKSMRDTVPESGLLSNKQTEFYTQMLDQQWSQHLSGQGLGVADQLVEQLEKRGMVPAAASASSGNDTSDDLIAGIPRGTPRVLGSDSAEETGRDPVHGMLADELDTRSATPMPDDASDRRMTSAFDSHKQAFLNELEAPARAASDKTGVPAEVILAQAALETGWGRREIPRADGGNSHNLFGIKAGSQWQGKTTDIATTEYVDGEARSVRDRFRVYDDFESAFTDYARLIGDNPRYADVLTASSPEAAARELQSAGYATDPAYADKLIAVMEGMRAERGDDALPATARRDTFSTEQVPTRIF
ncbi:flagellar assembly peptidoglycan hydrolase FlgJ [Aidingimonas lacisalsi]|uniref:flagellar assembly peptidoglycan hydrolase FlgJ n=1 Tax=Aidingimonas lacisalsi TaxID=2604086 RepID=UPI0011D27F13|nr:flagellar assembly peptidoglycan hydrolase FlgJ [Aidingimonas lacisalsi]